MNKVKIIIGTATGRYKETTLRGHSAWECAQNAMEDVQSFCALNEIEPMAVSIMVSPVAVSEVTENPLDIFATRPLVMVEEKPPTKRARARRTKAEIQADAQAAQQTEEKRIAGLIEAQAAQHKPLGPAGAEDQAVYAAMAAAAVDSKGAPTTEREWVKAEATKAKAVAEKIDAAAKAITGHNAAVVSTATDVINAATRIATAEPSEQLPTLDEMRKACAAAELAGNDRKKVIACFSKLVPPTDASGKPQPAILPNLPTEFYPTVLANLAALKGE